MHSYKSLRTAYVGAEAFIIQTISANAFSYGPKPYRQVGGRRL